MVHAVKHRTGLVIAKTVWVLNKSCGTLAPCSRVTEDPLYWRRYGDL